MRFCSNCGTQIEEGSKFCSNCGTRLPEAAPVTPEVNPTETLFEAAEQTPATTAVVAETAVTAEASATETTVTETTATETTVTETTAIEAAATESPVSATVQNTQNIQNTQTPAYYQAPHTYQTPQPVQTPPYAPYTPPAPQRKANVCGIIGLVLSCLGLFLCWLSIFNVILIPALVFVIIGLVQMKTEKKAAAITGAVIYLVALILTIVMTVVYIAIPFTAQIDEEDYNYTYNYDFEDDNTITDKLSTAYNLYCDDSFAYLSFDGSYLYVDTNPDDIKDKTEADAWEAIQNINDYLGFSDSVEEQMKNTRSIDGYQEVVNNDATVSWYYSTDTGLEVYYEIN